VRFLFIVLVIGSVASCSLPSQNDPKIDSLKGLAFVCEEYRIVLRDIRAAFFAGHIKEDQMRVANVIRKRISPLCRRGATNTTDSTLKEVSNGLRELMLIKVK